MPPTAARPSRPLGRSGTVLAPGDERLCPACHGKEWLTYDVAPGHPLFGQTVRCTVCGQGRQQQHLRAICGLRDDMLDWTFETTRRSASNAEAYDTAQLLADHPARFYTLLGGYGVGKTRLLACIVNTARAAGWTAIYTTTADVLDHLRRAYDPQVTIGYDARWQSLVDAKVLALDEFDRWNPTAWAREKFEQLINQRYNNQGQQLTAFAANADIRDLPGYVASRMQDNRCYLYHMSGQDVRRLLR